MTMTRQEVRQAVGQLMICGFEGQKLDGDLKEILRELRPLGLIAFARNIDSVPQISELNRELKMYRPEEPLLLSVDQEGGRVARLRQGVTQWPAMRFVGQAGDTKLAYALGQALARELRAIHFDVDFAPVLDVDTNPDNPIIGDRSFSRDPKVVAQMGAALIQGLQENGVGACGKHFPGHGDTHVDSHLALPRVEHELRRLQQIEWLPFQAAIDADVGAIMTAHVVVAALDTVPATLSKTILRHYLRDKLNFQGVIVSDDIDMKAVADHYTAEQLGVEGLRAGCDIFLACRNPTAMFALYRGIVRSVEQGVISHTMLGKAAQRARQWRQRFYQAPHIDAAQQAWLDCQAHADLAHRLSMAVGSV